MCLFQSEPKSLEPKVVLFKKKYMNSVLAVKQGSWTVFFIGTSNGQLIKVSGCVSGTDIISHLCEDLSFPQEN